MIKTTFKALALRQLFHTCALSAQSHLQAAFEHSSGDAPGRERAARELRSVARALTNAAMSMPIPSARLPAEARAVSLASSRSALAQASAFEALACAALEDEAGLNERARESLGLRGEALELIAAAGHGRPPHPSSAEELFGLMGLLLLRSRARQAAPDERAEIAEEARERAEMGLMGALEAQAASGEPLDAAQTQANASLWQGYLAQTLALCDEPAESWQGLWESAQANAPRHLLPSAIL